MNNVTFSLFEGEILGIAGPNDSGKSTLFNILARVPFGPSAGTVHFRDTQIDKMQAHRISVSGLA